MSIFFIPLFLYWNDATFAKVKNQHSDKIIFFDGLCALCNGSVKWIVNRDKNRVFKYAPLQGITANTKLQSLPKKHRVSSIILLDSDTIYTKSTAALKITKLLPAPFRWLYGLIIFPKAIRDVVYDFIAKKRYSWFGKYEVCTIPSTAEKDLFLD